MEGQKMMEAMRLAEYNKKMQFKHDLDMQILSKSSRGINEKQSDQMYMQYLLNKAQ